MLLLSIKELCQSIWTLYVSVWRERAVRVFVIEEWLTAVVVCERVPFPQDALTVTLPFSTFVPIFSPESRSPQWQMRLRLWQKGSCALGCCEQTQTRIRTSQITSNALHFNAWYKFKNHFKFGKKNACYECVLQHEMSLFQIHRPPTVR